MLQTYCIQKLQFWPEQWFPIVECALFELDEIIYYGGIYSTNFPVPGLGGGWVKIFVPSPKKWGGLFILRTFLKNINKICDYVKHFMKDLELLKDCSLKMQYKSIVRGVYPIERL